MHYATVPELRLTIDQCRGRAREWVDAYRPALRDPAADSAAAELEHMHYAAIRLGDLGNPLPREV